MKHLYLQLFFIGFLAGIFVNNLLQDTILSSIFFSILLFIITVSQLYVRHFGHFIISLFGGILLGIILSFWTLDSINNNLENISQHIHSSQEISTTIIDIRKKSEFSNEYVGHIKSISKSVYTDEKIYTLIQVPANFSLIPGDEITYWSKIYPIKDFEGFSYKNYMLSQDIYFKSYASSFVRNSSGNVSFLTSFFFDVRQFFLSELKELYPYEERIFLGGILLGAREDIPAQLKQDFNNSGLTHFIAVSGFNITILVIFFGYLFQYFPIRIRTFCVVVSIFSFTLLVGFSPPVVRAAIMGVVAYMILVSGRKADSMTLVLLTAFCMVVFSPLSLNYDVSFHLSFLAVIGIVYTQDFFKKIFYFLPSFLSIREAFVLTFAALSFTIPIMMFQFGQISLLAPIANVAVTWTIPIAMLLGFVSLIVYLIFPPLGYAVAFVDWIFLKYDILMVHFFGNIDWALLQVDFGVYGPYLQTVYFLVLSFLIITFQQRKKAA